MLITGNRDLSPEHYTRMDADIINKALLEAVSFKLPRGTSMAQVLMDTLSIGKEATYRRIRGEVPLSMYEAAILVKKFNISIDTIIETTLSENSVFELKTQRFYDFREKDYYMLYEYLNTLKYAATESYSDQVFASNIFPQFPSHMYCMLAKYSSFRWVYMNQGSNIMKAFNELEYPDEFLRVGKEIVQATMNIKNTCYIWDSSIFYRIVQEIKYFSKIQLIDKENIQRLKEDLSSLLAFIEDIAISGKFENGNKVQIYISNLNSDTSYLYLDTEHMHISMIGAFEPNHAVALDKKTLSKIKERILSLKRISYLISESGEMQRIQFIKEQREIINAL